MNLKDVFISCDGLNKNGLFRIFVPKLVEYLGRIRRSVPVGEDVSLEDRL